MIASLRGTLIQKEPNQAILECAGVGYDVAISVATFSALPGVGADAHLHIFTKVAEDQLALYGFAELDEKRLFERLIAVSGIGPRLAITVLSGIASERLVTAIRSADHGSLVKIPGIGKKTAERIVLELKDKLDDLQGFANGTAGPASRPGSLGGMADDVLSALVNLGYARPIAYKAVETALDKEPTARETFETLFRAAMSHVR